jgi:cytochrome c
MDSFTINKIAGAVLFTLLVVIGLRSVSGLLYETHPPEKLGYPVQTTAVEPDKAAAPKEPVKVVSITELLGSADVAKGQKVAKKCATCHSFNQGGPNKIGPNLYNIVSRKMASAAGFSYSSAIKAKAGDGKTWGYEDLAAFVLSPKKFISGTKMVFPGLKKASDRANLIVYLRSLSASPVPLP